MNGDRKIKDHQPGLYYIILLCIDGVISCGVFDCLFNLLCYSNKNHTLNHIGGENEIVTSSIEWN